MSLLPSFRWKSWIVALLLPCLAACSTVRLTYGQGPLLAYWWLDGYADFSSEQSPRVKDALAEWFAWHRATQLPDYAALLAEVQQQAMDKVTPAQVCKVVEQAELRLERAFEQAVPAAAEIVRSLSMAQLRHLEQRYEKGNRELQREQLQRPASERHEATLKRWQERAESFYGPLDEAQRRLLADALPGLPFDAQIWLDERRSRQQDILAGLRRALAERADAGPVQAALRAFAAQQKHSPRAEYRAYRQRLMQAQCELVARLHNAASSAQRQRALDKLKDWEDDLRALARTGNALRVPRAPSPGEG